jgi:hypothetical protein
MKIKHAKSDCCDASIQRWGGKRRWCANCHITWRIRPKRRGPKARRPSWAWLRRALLYGDYLKGLPRQRPDRSVQAISFQFRGMLRRLAAQPASMLPGRGPLTLISDGLWFRFGQKRWVLYLYAFKPCRENRAYFGEPLLWEGAESASQWRQVIEQIPMAISKRICAWVVDNIAGIRILAAQKGWVLQLCHFHLIAALQNRRGLLRKALMEGGRRESIYQLIRQLLELTPGPASQKVLRQLRTLLDDPLMPWRLRSIGREFIKRLPHFRAYQAYPEYHLPTTTSALESTGSLIRERLRRARNLRSPKSLQLWATAMLRLRKTIVCNGKNQPNYLV